MSHKHVVWCGEHFGAYWFDSDSHKSAEASYYRTFWSPKGDGFTVFLRFYGIDGGEKVTGIFTDNLKATAYLKGLLSKMKKWDNIVNTMNIPISTGRAVSGTRESGAVVESFHIGDQTLEIRWADVDTPHLTIMMEDRAIDPLGYFCALSLPERVTFTMNMRVICDAIMQPVGKSEENPKSMAFLGFSEIWFCKRLSSPSQITPFPPVQEKE